MWDELCVRGVRWANAWMHHRWKAKNKAAMQHTHTCIVAIRWWYIFLEIFRINEFFCVVEMKTSSNKRLDFLPCWGQRVRSNSMEIDAEHDLWISCCLLHIAAGTKRKKKMQPNPIHSDLLTEIICSVNWSNAFSLPVSNILITWHVLWYRICYTI